MVPAPSGPKGLGYMLVLAGLGIPKGAPEIDKAKDAIKTLTTPDVQIEVLRQNAFFPVTNAEVPTDLPGAIALANGAINAQRSAPNAILSLPPVGLGPATARWRSSSRTASRRSASTASRSSRCWTHRPDS
jgi:multiple sugar transport system substrate-binding protein